MDNLSNTAHQVSLKNSTIILVLGILSILGCCLYGAGLILGIIALVLASKDLAKYNAQPDNYTKTSFSNIKAGRICAIIGIVLSILFIIYLIVLIRLLGWDVVSSGDTEAIMEALQNLKQ